MMSKKFSFDTSALIEIPKRIDVGSFANLCRSKEITIAIPSLCVAEIGDGSNLEKRAERFRFYGQLSSQINYEKFLIVTGARELIDQELNSSGKCSPFVTGLMKTEYIKRLNSNTEMNRLIRFSWHERQREKIAQAGTRKYELEFRQQTTKIPKYSDVCERNLIFYPGLTSEKKQYQSASNVLKRTNAKATEENLILAARSLGYANTRLTCHILFIRQLLLGLSERCADPQLRAMRKISLGDWTDFVILSSGIYADYFVTNDVKVKTMADFLNEKGIIRFQAISVLKFFDTLK